MATQLRLCFPTYDQQSTHFQKFRQRKFTGISIQASESIMFNIINFYALKYYDIYFDLLF